MKGLSNINVFIVISLFLHLVLFTQYQRQKTTISDSVSSVDFNSESQITSVRLLSKPKANNKNNVEIKAVTKNKNLKKKMTKDPIDAVLDVLEKDKLNNTQKDDVIPPAYVGQTAGSIKTDKNLYLKKIITEIEKNKYYPTLARRRKMQDIVHVSFQLHNNGVVNALNIRGRYKTLRVAARSAVLNASLRLKPPPEINLPFEVNYSMAFSLK